MGGVSKPMIGQRFGRLTVLRRAPDYVAPSGNHFALWLCRCDCGAEVRMRGDHLRDGTIVSCGCYKAEMMKERMRELGKRRWANRR